MYCGTINILHKDGRILKLLKYKLVIILFIVSVPLFALETGQEQAEKNDFFMAPLVEIIGYSSDGAAYGGGISLGAGSGTAIGFSLLYTVDQNSVNTLEITVFLRFYLSGPQAYSGPFLQLNTGAAVFEYDSGVSLPSKAGSLSAGINAGWRFPLGERWCLETSLRFGYPYKAGALVSAALRL